MKTREQFEAKYAADSGVTVDWLRDHGRQAQPCDCGETYCEGWQMDHAFYGHGAGRPMGIVNNPGIRFSK